MTSIVERLRAAGCVFAEDEAHLLTAAATSPRRLRALVERRVAGAPLEHLLGWVEFCGRRVAVDPGVFVPRRRTELLVRTAARLAPPGGTVVDVACGCGAVAVGLLAARPDLTGYATDIDPAAVRCAARNLRPLGGRARLGDLCDPLPARLRGRVAVLVANVPYVPSAEIGLMPRESRLNERAVALDGGADGLAVLRRLAGVAPRWLAPDGALVVEASEHLLAGARSALRAAGLRSRVVRRAALDAVAVIAIRHIATGDIATRDVATGDIATGRGAGADPDPVSRPAAPRRRAAPPPAVAR